MSLKLYLQPIAGRSTLSQRNQASTKQPVEGISFFVKISCSIPDISAATKMK
jgi:hypothetical protein